MTNALIVAEKSIAILSDRMRSWRDLGFDLKNAVQELGFWLEGLSIDLPHSAEPYQLIAQAVIETDTRCLVTNLASALLWDWAGQAWHALIADRAQYNLLHLCVELRDESGTLSAPVWELFEKRVVKGDYRGFDLRSALLAAMIYNQPDQPWVEVFWKKLLSGNPDEYVGGKVVYGFRGLIRWRGLARMSAVEREKYLAGAFQELWRIATQISRTDLAWNEFRRLLDTHPAVNPDRILHEAGIPEAAQALGRLQEDASNWLSREQFELQTAEHCRRVWRKIFQAVLSDALEPKRTRCQILEKLRMIVRQEIQAELRQTTDGHQALDLLTFIYNRTHPPALPHGLTKERAERAFAATR